MGKNAPNVPDDSSAKEEIQKALSHTAGKHGKKVICVSNEMLQQDNIPNGIDEIPLFHFGMKGIDKLNGRFDVIWELNGHYYHPSAVQEHTERPTLL